MSLEIVDNESKEQISMIGNYETDEEVKQEEQKKNNKKIKLILLHTIQTKPTQTETITEKYIGTLRIPKISLKRFL